LLLEVLVLFTLELTIVPLLAEVDELAEEVGGLEEGVEVEVMLADLCDEVQDFLLTLQRSDGIDLIEGILLKDDIVDNL
jgi:hypothetical protein